MTTAFSERLTSYLDAFLEAVLSFVPGLLAALLLMVLGLFVAWVLRFVVTGVLRAARFDRYCEGSGISLALARADIRVSPTALVGRLVFWLVFLSLAVAGLSAILLFLVRLAVISQRRPSVTGASGMVGIAGLAVTPIPAGGTGRVSARGELWTARCAEAVAAGEAVVVSGLDGLVLTVRRTPAREGPTP